MSIKKIQKNKQLNDNSRNLYSKELVKSIDSQVEKYEYNLKLNKMSFLFIKKSIFRIFIVWISIFASSILVILSTMVPVALSNVKNGIVSQFGKYNSYSEYANNSLNVPIPKFNMEQNPNIDPNQGQNINWYGGVNPINGGAGTDNRYDTFLSDGSDMNQIAMNDKVFSGAAALNNFSNLGYLGGIVLSSIWINQVKTNPTFQNHAIIELVCNLLGVPKDDKSRDDGVAGCITYVVNQNAPSYIRQKLFAESNPNFYLSFGKIAYNAYKDNLFTYIDGKPSDDIDSHIKLWGLDNGNDYNIKNIKGEDLLKKLYEVAPDYQDSDEFPTILNLSAYNSLKINHGIKKDLSGKLYFEYEVPFNIMEVKHDDGKWYMANPNNFYYQLVNGESVFYDNDSSVATNFNGSNFGVSGTYKYQDLVDYMVSRKATPDGPKARIHTFTKKIKCVIIGIADKQLGDPKIYTTHMAANEMSGYFHSNSHYFYKDPAARLYPQSLGENVEESALNDSLKIKSYHIASDGHPDINKKYNYVSNTVGQETNIGIIPGGYSLYDLTSENNNYFNAKLTTNSNNDDLTNFTLYNPFGAYDRFGLSNGLASGWDPQNPSDWSAKNPDTTITDNSSNKAAPNILSLYSKQLIVENIDKVIILVLSIVYVVLAFLIVVSLIIILVSSNIIIDDNKFNISAFKVLGYTNRDISKIILGVYNYVVAFAFLLAIPIVIGMMLIITSKITSSLNNSLSGFHSHFSDFFAIWQIPVAALIIFLVFSLNMMINKRILNKIQAIDVLKR